MKQRSDHLKHVVHGTLAKILAGAGDPADLMWKLVDEVQKEAGGGTPVERLVETNACSKCGEKDSVCFRCKAGELVGEHGLAALPVLAPKLIAAVKEWAQDRDRRRRLKAAQEEAQEAEYRARAAAAAQSTSRRPPPPPAGPQRF